MDQLESAQMAEIKEEHPASKKSLKNLAKDLKEFYLSKEMSDVQIKCGDQTFDAHQFILSARSPVFRRMFQTEMKEKNTGLVDLGDSSPEIISELLKFIYTGSCCVNDDSPSQIVCDLLQAANKYELEHLKELCENALSSKVTSKNSLEVSKSFFENIIMSIYLISILSSETCMKLGH